MSHPNYSAQSRKKLTKCSSTSASNHNSNHKLKRISSTSTYLAVNDDELSRDKSSLEITSILATESRKDLNRNDRKIDKTSSSTTFSGGRKFWNCNAKPTSLYVPDNAAIQEESELIGALSKQLYLVESQLQKVQSDYKRSEEQVKLKDQEIGHLKRKVKDWETKSKNQETLRKKEQQERRIQADNSEYLYRRCLMLEHRIFEMEKFLADYGLIWVGDTNGPKCPETITNDSIETCYDQIIANIDQLNLAAGKGEVHVQHNEKGNGATFKTSSCMCLKFYKNGMIVHDGPLRPYNDPATISFLRDILDGYFPSELQSTYPNGVPFKVEDHRNQMYLNNSYFPGQGYRLGKQHPVDNTSLSPKPRRLATTSQKSTRRCPIPKESTFDFSTQLVPSTARIDSFTIFKDSTLVSRSLKSKSPSETPPLEMYVLRSQILASHNNICSDSHLQSHINAELGLGSRKEKRDVATKNADYDVFAREAAPKTRGALRFPSSGRYYHSSGDRSSSRLSPCRLENADDRFRHRSRSASVPNSRLSVNAKWVPKAKLATDFGNVEASQFTNAQTRNNTVKKNQRVAKSAAPTRKNAPPILHQVNEPSGTPGELRLKVRSLNGGTVYLVHVSADEPIARLYQLLDRAMARSIPRGYKIVLSGYSPRRLEQLGITLREIGVTRDSVLHLVND